MYSTRKKNKLKIKSKQLSNKELYLFDFIIINSIKTYIKIVFIVMQKIQME
jgi:hypothetical protein